MMNALNKKWLRVTFGIQRRNLSRSLVLRVDKSDRGLSAKILRRNTSPRMGGHAGAIYGDFLGRLIMT